MFLKHVNYFRNKWNDNYKQVSSPNFSFALFWEILLWFTEFCLPHGL